MSKPLEQEPFEAFLERLGPDRESAGTCYEQLRRRLVTIFEYRRCQHPEELADETLDRAARRLREMGSDFVGDDPSRFVFGVAWNVARESFRRPSPVQLADGWEQRRTGESREEGDEREAACLEQCLDSLAALDRSLLLGYHQGEKGGRIRHRSGLAHELGLSPNALRLRIHRLTARLRGCTLECLETGRMGAGPRSLVRHHGRA